MKKLSEIFDIKNTKSLELINCEEDEAGILFVSRTSENNWIVARVKVLDEIDPMPGHAITVALGGSVLSSFYQNEDFYTSFHIAALYPKMTLSKQEMLFYCACIEANKYKYSYWRQANKTLKDILVPSPEEIPDFVKNYEIENVLNSKSIISKNLTLETEKWKWFRYDEIFDIQIWRSIDLNKLEQGNGTINYVARTEENNWITARVVDDGTFEIYEWNCLTVPMVWNELKASYQTEKFCVSQNISIFRQKANNLNKYNAIFLNTLIRKDMFRFAYGRTLSLERLKMLKIKLPVTPSWTPDWQFMEDYIKSLPYSASL